MDGSITIERNNSVLDGNGFTSSAVLLNSVSNLTVKNFIITKGGEIQNGFAGISLTNTSHSTVENNTITGITNFLYSFLYYETSAGIIVSGGSSNIISGNNLVNNNQGMEFNNTAYNLIVGNNITYSATAEDKQGYNNPAGIYFDNSSNNTIYHNNFEISIGGQAGDSYYNSVNIWDNGYPSGGNYWMNYRAKEIDYTGIGNKQYVIDSLDAGSANNTDRYPLMEPFNSTFYTLQNTPPEISLLSPLNQTYSNSSVALTFSVEVLSPDKSVNWTGYSLDGQPNVTITSHSSVNNVTIANMTSGVHDITVYARDAYGNIGTSQTIVFTIVKPEPFLTITVLAVSAAAVVMVAVGLLIYLRKHKH